MCPLFETICLKDGALLHVPYYAERLNRSRKLLFGKSDALCIKNAVSIPSYCSKGLWKCRIAYAESLLGIEFVDYKPKQVRCLTCVNGDAIDYTYKSVDRSDINALMAKVYTDDILIIKKGLVTDTSIANIAF